MKKHILPVLLGFVLLFPFHLESKELCVRMTFGLFTGGNVTDSWHLNPDSYDYTLTQGKKTTPGMDFTLEFIYQIHPNISFSLGTGYISRSLSGNSGQFTPFGTNEVVENFSCSPKLSSEMIPFYLTSIFSFPVNSFIQFNFLGGIGYYLGNIKGSEMVPRYAEAENPSMIANRLIWKFESSAHTIGFHAGAGIDITLPLNMSLSLETLYRVANFKDIKTSLQRKTGGVPQALADTIGETGEDLGEDLTFFYAQKVRVVEEQKNIDYQISRFSYSGFSFRAGIKFKF